LNKFAKDSGKLKRFCNPPWGVDFKVSLAIFISTSLKAMRARLGSEHDGLTHVLFGLTIHSGTSRSKSSLGRKSTWGRSIRQIQHKSVNIDF
jgi:hypothetical protein